MYFPTARDRTLHTNEPTKPLKRPALPCFMFQTSTFFDYRIINQPVEATASSVCDIVRDGGQASFVFLNPHSIVLAESDPELKTSLTAASGSFCDGIGLWWAHLLTQRQRVQRISGYDFFHHVSTELSRRKQGHVFFLGGDAEKLAIIKKRYTKEFGGIAAVSSYSPPFKLQFSDDDIGEMARRINEAGADVLWIGLGSPKQELVLSRLMRLIDVRIAAAIGAVFDFYAGTVPQAPRLVRTLGLEWLYRLFHEPRRLWRRTLVSAPLFVALVLRRCRLR